MTYFKTLSTRWPRQQRKTMKNIVIAGNYQFFLFVLLNTAYIPRDRERDRSVNSLRYILISPKLFYPNNA
jgi:hypothetical protein